MVDPVVQAYVGSIRTADADGNPQTRSWWDNIRGARFQGVIDGKWHVGGELLERQGLAEPLLGFWATDYRIPGWGRANWARRRVQHGGRSILRRHVHPRLGRTPVPRMGMGRRVDALHMEQGERVLFVPACRTCTVPASDPPACATPNEPVVDPLDVHSAWAARETAEALLERSRAIFLTHEQRIGSHFVVQGIYNFSWEVTRQRQLEDGKRSDSRKVNCTPPPGVAGLDVQFHQRIASARITAYAQQSLTWIEHAIRAPSPRSRPPRSGDRWMARAEWTKRDPIHCRECHIADGSFGPIKLS